MPEQPTKVPDEWIAALKRHELLTAFRHAATAYQRQSVAKGLPKPTDYEAAVAATKLAPFTHAIAGHPLPDNAKLLAKALPSFDLLARIENPPAALAIAAPVEVRPATPAEQAAADAPLESAPPVPKQYQLPELCDWATSHLSQEVSLTAEPGTVVAPSPHHYAWWLFSRTHMKEFFAICAKNLVNDTAQRLGLTDDDRQVFAISADIKARARKFDPRSKELEAAKARIAELEAQLASKGAA